ncbi:MAG: ctaC [Chitinophagaceae bacterium]|nr:ctaC [Chitinophagaceae bacterium]
MTTIYILAAVVLIVAILVVIFRLQVLSAVLKGRYEKRVGIGNDINALLFLIIFVVGLAGFWYSYNQASAFFLPAPSSEHGVKTDYMFWFTMAILVLAFVVTNALLYVFPIFYKFKEDRKAYFYPDNHKLEMIWTIIPALVMAGLVVFGYKEWTAITSPAPKNAEVIEIMGKQFAWQVRYPGADGVLGNYNYRNIDAINEFGIDMNDSASYDDFIPRELHLPKGKPVLLNIRARDVIHSVFLPHFRVKMDAVPGMPTHFWFVPTKTTAEMRIETGNAKFNYELACTEVCGRGHYAMRFLVVVDEPADYEKWKAEQESFASVNRDYAAEKAPKLVSLLPVKKTADSTSTEAPVTTPSTDSTSTKVDSTATASK